MNHREEVHGQFLETCAQATALLEPADALLDHAPTAVKLAVEPVPAVVRVLVFPAWNHRFDGVSSQPVTDPCEAVALVTCERPGACASADPDAVHDFLELRALVDLARGDVDREGKAVAVSDQVDFAPESAARAAH